MKSELQWTKRDCLDCPALSQETVQTINPAYPETAVIKKNEIVWLDKSVVPNHAYRYQIGLLDSRGNVLSSSNEAVAALLPSPPAPRDLTSAQEAQGILLRWRSKAPAEGNIRFVVERRSRNEAWEKISEMPIKGNSFFDPAVASNQLYDYRVYTLLVAGKTNIWGKSATAYNVKAPGALPPPPPENVWIIPAQGALEVRWTESDGAVAGYHVYRKEGKEIIRLTVNPIKHPPYIDRSAKPNRVYSYAVSAVSSKAGQREGLLSKWVEIRNVQFGNENLSRTRRELQ